MMKINLFAPESSFFLHMPVLQALANCFLVQDLKKRFSHTKKPHPMNVSHAEQWGF
ncbi:hypothetical protein NLX71_22180 [Paenibacillus sp. MZ04-78.2]|uniref:hypothetical protein n=1 Tax=Paenibacillus sp. MZ04-78.2 TaxID=2962034 RepID=UPI0020B7859B|nr:hypothetical protein [Paenibacillus sp. MZ04-78.2]MCP3775976.1 hypothetical protein [Paenibacillus sp. MZ04-78.2]